MAELWPLAVKTYPGEEWKVGPEGATFEADDGRRGKLWVLGAVEPASGQGELIFSDGRARVSHLRLLEQMVTQSPAERWLTIEDNQSIHTSRPVQSHVRLLAQRDRALALKGRRFETLEELTASLQEALVYWNDH